MIMNKFEIIKCDYGYFIYRANPNNNIDKYNEYIVHGCKLGYADIEDDLSKYYYKHRKDAVRALKRWELKQANITKLDKVKVGDTFHIARRANPNEFVPSTFVMLNNHHQIGRYQFVYFNKYTMTLHGTDDADRNVKIL